MVKVSNKFFQSFCSFPFQNWILTKTKINFGVTYVEYLHSHVSPVMFKLDLSVHFLFLQLFNCKILEASWFYGTRNHVDLTPFFISPTFMFSRCQENALKNPNAHWYNIIMITQDETKALNNFLVQLLKVKFTGNYEMNVDLFFALCIECFDLWLWWLLGIYGKSQQSLRSTGQRSQGFSHYMDR